MRVKYKNYTDNIVGFLNEKGLIGSINFSIDVNEQIAYLLEKQYRRGQEDKQEEIKRPLGLPGL